MGETTWCQESFWRSFLGVDWGSSVWRCPAIQRIGEAAQRRWAVKTENLWTGRSLRDESWTSVIWKGWVGCILWIDSWFSPKNDLLACKGKIPGPGASSMTFIKLVFTRDSTTNTMFSITCTALASFSGQVKNYWHSSAVWPKDWTMEAYNHQRGSRAVADFFRLFSRWIFCSRGKSTEGFLIIPPNQKVKQTTEKNPWSCGVVVQLNRGWTFLDMYFNQLNWHSKFLYHSSPSSIVDDFYFEDQIFWPF